VEQTTSLQDVLLDIFEEAAGESGLFAAVSFENPEDWRSGELHRSLRPGHLVRVTAPTRIIDAEHVGAEITRALGVLEAFAYFEEAQDPTPLPPSPPPQAQKRSGKKVDPEEFRQAAIDARIASALGISVEGAVAIKIMFERLLGTGISVRVFPCGAEAQDLALTGRLVTRDGYLRDEHDTLFAKYGWGASEWTVIAQVATVPDVPEPVEAAPVGETAGSTPRSENPERSDASVTSGAATADASDPPDTADTPDASDTHNASEDTRDRVDRAEFEGLGIDLMKSLAEAGVVGAPQFPGLTITPIAIYRDVPILDADPDEAPAP
jgi:hypothetical protein